MSLHGTHRLGGLLSTTALNMLVLPALYWLFGDQTSGAPVDQLASGNATHTLEARPS